MNKEELKEKIFLNGGFSNGKSTYGFNKLIDGALNGEINMYATAKGNVFIISEDRYNQLRAEAYKPTPIQQDLVVNTNPEGSSGYKKIYKHLTGKESYDIVTS